MQLFVLALVMTIIVHDAMIDPSGVARGIGLGYGSLLVLIHVACGAAYGLLCHRALVRLHTSPTSILRWLDAASTTYRWSVLALYLVGILCGTLDTVRQAIGDLVLLDEIVVLAPPLCMMVWSWWGYYPIDHRLRQAPLIRHLDEGIPITPIWSRKQYVISQLRHQVALVLIPILALMGWSEMVLGNTPWELQTSLSRQILMLAGAAVVFLFTPVVIRYLWDTVPLPPGQLRDQLTKMCKQYRIGIRQLLLWRTFGCVINAAVMGVIAPVRYILLTDALLEWLPGDRIKAVMAHELAHISKHHMFWLLIAAAAAAGGPTVVWPIVIEIAAASEGNVTQTTMIQSLLAQDPMMIDILSFAATLASWVFLFGWVSRRFERQADTFAVVHFARHERPGTLPTDHNLIDIRSVRIMAGALQQVADLNHVSIDRKSWRHGSIAWRQEYLHQLVGESIDDQPIDRQVMLIKIVSAATIVALPVAQWALYS